VTPAGPAWRGAVVPLLIGGLLGFIGGYFAAGGGRPSGTAARTVPEAGGGDRLAALRGDLERDPENPKLLTALGNAHYDREEWDLAIEAYEKARREAPADANLLSDLGAAYRNRGEFGRAVHFFERARESDAEHWQSLLNLTLVHAFDTGDTEAAERCLDELKRRYPDIPRLDRIAEKISRRRAGV